jgi:beta-lactamase regulating signal transducer with metallopeptidase domain
METLVHIGLTNALLATILAAGVAGLAIACRRRPAVAHSLWVLVLIKFLVPSFYPIPIPGWNVASTSAKPSESTRALEIPQSLLEEPQASTQFEDSVPDTHKNSVMSEQPKPVRDSDSDTSEFTPPPETSQVGIQFSWMNSLGILWLSGSLVWATVAMIRIARFRRLVRKARPGEAKLQARVQWLAERLGLSSYPAVRLVAAPVPPLLWGLTRTPQLLIPVHLWERLSEEQQNTLLLHELAHLRRGDHWVRRLELVVFAVYWWHPVVWWAMRQLRETEEQCCDAWVVSTLPNSGHSYAAALVETLDFLSHSRLLLPLGASGIEPLRLLKRRLSMIVREQTPRAMPRWALGTVVVLGVALLPLLPIPAQQSGGDEGQDAAPQSLPGGNQSAQSAEQPLPGLPSIQPDRSEQIEAARDQVELMEAKVLIKRAEIEEMNLRIRQAQRNLQRLEELYKRGVLEESSLNKARNEAELLPTQLPIKKAELAEVEVSLKQAMRRLSRLESNPGPSMGMGMPPPTMRPAGKGAMGGSGIGRPGMMGPKGPTPGAGGLGDSETRSDVPTGGAMRGGGGEGPGAGLPGAPGAAGPGGMIRGMGAMGVTGGLPGGAIPGPNGGPGGRAASSGGGGMMGGPGGLSRLGRSGVAGLFEEKSWDFGSVRRGERARHEFRLTNTLDQPIHISAVRVSAAFLKADARDGWIKPNDSVTIPVEMDTRRFAGDKTATVYVQFDQPVPGEVRLQVQAQSPDPGAATNIPAESRESKAKIIDLEQKVDQLMRQIDALHHELKQRPGKPPGGGAGPTPGPEAGDSTKP